MNTQTERPVFHIKTWVISPFDPSAAEMLISALCSNKPTQDIESVFLIQDKTQYLSYSFTFYPTETIPNLSPDKFMNFETGFCFIILFSSYNKSTFENIKSLYARSTIPTSLQKHGFLMLLDVKMPNDGPLDQKQIPTTQAESFASENGMFFLEISLAQAKKNIQLLQKIMRIRASHLERKDFKEMKDIQHYKETSIDLSESSKDFTREISKEFHEIKDSSYKDQKFQRNQKKPIDLSTQENPYDLPLKTPQFTKDLMLLSKEKFNSHTTQLLPQPPSKISSQILGSSNLLNQSQATSTIVFPHKLTHQQSINYQNQGQMSLNLQKVKEKVSGLKDFVVKNEVIIPVFETSLTDRSPIKKINSSCNSNSNSNISKLKSKISKSIYEGSKENSKDIGIMEIELEGGLFARVPLLVDDNAFKVIDRLMKLVGQQWGIQKVKKMAYIIEKTVNEHIETMIDGEL